MNEFNQGWLFSANMIVACIASVWYWLGGRAGGPGKWIRRYLAPLVLCLAVCLTACVMGKFSWWLLAVYPLTTLGFVLGYGGKNKTWRVIKRVIVAIVLTIPGVLCCMVFGGKAWLLLPVHAVINGLTAYLGTINPLMPTAEEGILGMMFSIVLLGYPFIGV
jgi:hypothetical protein